MATSNIDVVNRALMLIGAKPIVSFNEESQNARIMKRLWETCLKGFLSRCLWTFATKRALLSTSTDTPAWTTNGEEYVYQKPSDCIRIFGRNMTSAMLRIEGNQILSDSSGLGILYVFYQDDITKFSASAIEALADKLASEAAFAVLNDAKKAEFLLQKYNSITLPDAMVENSQEQDAQAVEDSDWLIAKYGGGASNAVPEFRY